MDAFLSIIPLRTFFQNAILVKNTALPEINSKGEDKTTLVKIKKKALVSDYMDTVNVRLFKKEGKKLNR